VRPARDVRDHAPATHEEALTPQRIRNVGALAPNDRLLVSAKACKADLANGGMPDLTAKKIAAHPARSQ